MYSKDEFNEILIIEWQKSLAVNFEFYQIISNIILVY